MPASHLLPLLRRLFATILLASPAITLAEEPVPTPAHSVEVLRLNVSPSGYPPYVIVTDNDHSGIIWDVVSRIADRLDFTLVAEKIPRKRVDQMLLRGFIDATPRAIEWTDTPEDFLFSDPIVRVQECIIVPADSPLNYTGPDDLRGKTVVTHLGYNYPTLEPLLANGELQRFDVSQDKDMFDYLIHGERFDAAIADRLVGQWVIRQEQLQGKVRFSEHSLTDFGFRLMFRPDWHSFVERFNAELAALQASGELDEILSNYR